MIARGTPKWVLYSLLPALAFLILFLVSDSSEGYRPVFFFSGLILFIISLLLLSFFRDPEREPEAIRTGGEIIAPADGRVMFVREAGDRWHIAIFMNIYNVHVNRFPYSGIVEEIRHIDGSYKPAFKKGSGANERAIMKLETSAGEIEIIRIAGIVARRIVSYVSEGQPVRRGQRMGLIRFGSRVDTLIPKDEVEITVSGGDRVKAGVDIIGLYETKSIK